MAALFLNGIVTHTPDWPVNSCPNLSQNLLTEPQPTESHRTNDFQHVHKPLIPPTRMMRFNLRWSFSNFKQSRFPNVSMDRILTASASKLHWRAAPTPSPPNHWRSPCRHLTLADLCEPRTGNIMLSCLARWPTDSVSSQLFNKEHKPFPLLCRSN